MLSNMLIKANSTKISFIHLLEKFINLHNNLL